MDQELLDELQIKICQRFKDQKLLQQALTHPKFDPECHYERLEFLGDSILNNAITIELYNHHSYDREGSLSRRREKLISNAYLTRVAVGKLDLAKYIRIPYGITPALCDFFEAIIGAVYLDAGPDKAHAVVTRCLWDKEFESRHRSRSPVDRPASANNNRSRQLDQFRTKRNGQPSAAVNSKRDASPVACSSQNRSSPSKENSSGKQVIDHTPAMRIYSRELIKTLDDNGIPFTELNALQGTHYKNPPEMRYSVRVSYETSEIITLIHV